MKVRYLRKFKPEDLGNLASKLVVKNCKQGEILCDQNASCRNLYIIKNGQISLSRVIKKETIDTADYPAALLEQLAKTPDEVEIEVKLKYNPGDLLLVTEIVSTQPSKFRVRAKIPSQVYLCTVFDIARYIGMEKFRRIPDADFFEVADADLFRHHIESQLWTEYRECVVGEELTVIENKHFYTNSKIRSAAETTKHFRVKPKATEYFKSKQEFFAPKDHLLSRLQGEKKTVPNLNEVRWEKSKADPEEPSSKFRKSLPRIGQFAVKDSFPIEDEEMDGEGGEKLEKKIKKLIHNEYKNQLDDDYLSAIYKFQFKKIVSAAYKDRKPVYFKELPRYHVDQSKLQILPSQVSKVSISKSKNESHRRNRTFYDNQVNSNHTINIVDKFKSQNNLPYSKMTHKKVFSTGAIPSFKIQTFSSH